MIGGIRALDANTLAALGAVLSALLAAGGYIAKIRYERKRTLRSALFYLLQLRWRAALDERLTAELPARLLTSLNVELTRQDLGMSAAERESILQASRPILSAAAERQAVVETQEIRVRLLNSLADLAKDLPVLAYRLSAGLPAFDEVPDLLPSGDQTISKDARGIASCISSHLHASLYSERARLAKQNLTALIRIASGNVSIWTFVESHLAMRTQDRAAVPDEYFDRLATTFGGALPAVLEHASSSLRGPQQITDPSSETSQPGSLDFAGAELR